MEENSVLINGYIENYTRFHRLLPVIHWWLKLWKKTEKCRTND